MVTSNSQHESPSLAEPLHRALEELERFGACINRLRAPRTWVSRGLRIFSPTALDNLGDIVQHGCDTVRQRVEELGLPGNHAGSAARSKSRRLASSEPAPDDPQALLIAYRVSGRALCAALVEARRLHDSSTAAVLAAVVHRLEKQLWLLDSYRPREPVGFRAVNLFLLC